MPQIETLSTTGKGALLICFLMGIRLAYSIVNRCLRCRKIYQGVLVSESLTDIKACNKCAEVMVAACDGCGAKPKTSLLR